MTTFTIRVTTPGLGADTNWGSSPDLGAPSFFDLYVTGSTDPSIPNGRYDGYCLNPGIGIYVSPSTYTADGLAGNVAPQILPAGTNSIDALEVKQLNWLLAQNFTSDAKYGGAYGFGEVQAAIWNILGFPDSDAMDPVTLRILTANNTQSFSLTEAKSLADEARAAIASGDPVLPTDAFFSAFIDPAGNVQPMIIQLQSAKLGDYVWSDSNANGIQDAGETGVDRVIVELYRVDASGGLHFVTSTVTGDDYSTAGVEHGFYQFAGLKAGDYQVKFIAPTGELFTTHDAGGNTHDGVDSDANLTTGFSQVVTLAAGESNQTVDAGLVKSASLGDRLWVDTNGDGKQDSGEAGIVGQTVTLIGGGADGVIGTADDTIATTTTGADGVYSFTGLTPGVQYQVQFSAPAGTVFTGQNVSANGFDTIDSDADTVTGKTQIVTLAQGENNPTLDAGVYTPATLSGFVYQDVGNDGVRNAEPGIGGVTLTLTGTDGAGNPVTATTTTAPDGSYHFVGLPPGTYSVAETQPAGYADGKDTVGTAGGSNAVNDVLSQVVLGSGVTSVENNFGEQLTASLGDRLWVDANGNGKQDGGEAGIVGQTVTLIGGGADGLINGVGDTTATTTTGADGVYSFTGLTPGVQYQVQFSAPAGTVFTGQNVSANGFDTIDSDADTVSGKTQIVTLAQGESNTTLDAGVYAPGNLTGYVYKDAGNDGVRNAEPGIAGVTLTLTGTNGLGQAVTGTATTDANGYYHFDNLAPGTYTVSEAQPAGYIDGKDTVGSTGGSNVVNDVLSGIVLGSGVTSVENNFGEVVTASLGDRVWLDTNGNGQQDAGEAGVGGVTVNLLDANGVVVSTQTTSASGNYLFTNLNPGSYSVQFVAPSGYLLTGKDVGADASDSDADTTTGKTGQYVLQSGDSNLTVDAGLVQKAHIGDFIWEDKNANGVQDAGEAGIAGVTVNLKDAGGNIVATTTTTANGGYGFDVAPGTYSVQVSVPAGYLVTGKDLGSNDATDSDISSTGATGLYTLASGDVNNTVDGGLYKTATIGDRIWYDKNANGVQDAGEAGVAGVKVELRDNANNVLSTTTTDANGNYLFTNLTPGGYHIDVVESTLPAGSVFTLSNQGANDAVDSDVRAITGQPLIWGIMDNTTLDSGEDDRSWDAGIYKVGIDVEKYVSSNTSTTVNNCGGEGASVNYWKSNCVYDWYTWSYTWSGTGCKASDSFNTVFGCNVTNGTKSIYDVLCGTGTTSQDVLMRECVAAYLNACHTNVNYAYSKDEVCAETRYAFSSGSYDSVCKGFSYENNQGCNWTTTKSTWNSTVDTQLYDADAPPGLEVKTGSTVTFTYIVKNTGDTALKNVVLTDDRIATVTYISGDANANGLLDTNETWTYKASEVAQSGTIKNTGTVTAVDAVGGVANVTDKDDAYYTGSGAAKASLGDRVWYDGNANGVQDSGEVGIAGVKVTLTGAGADGAFGTKDDITATTTTNATGLYQFNNLAAGKYTVTFGDVAGYALTKLDQGGNDARDSDAITSTRTTGVITLASNEQNLTVDAGLYKVGIDVEKYVSGNTTTTANNCGGEGANVSWWKSNCTWQSSLGSNGWSGTGCKSTDSFNTVFGCNVTNGTKSIYDVLCGTGTTTQDVLMRESVAAYLNACHTNIDYAYSKDQVCAETRYAFSSGSYDSVCKGFSYENNQGCNWTTTKSTWNCTVDSQLYDADAPPGLDVRTGSTVTFTYVVKNTGDTALKNVVLTDDRIATVTYVSGDANANGLLDTNETWTYKASEVASAGTIKNTGTVTAVDAVGGVANVTDKDDAYYTGTGAVATKGSIGDRVWEDKNFNGIQDTGETGLAGVKVTLKGAGADGLFGTQDDVTSTTTTSATGAYEFNNLAAGKYQLFFGDGSNTGYTVTKQNQGADDSKDSDIDANGATGVITLAAGEHNLTVDAGAYRKACVGDKVWEDWNHNNIQDVGEGGIGGITVKLLNTAGTVLATTTTDGNGNYLFSNIDPGSYVLQFDKTNVTFNNSHWGGSYNMSNWKWAVKDVGTNDAVDSDVTGDATATTNVTKTDAFTLVSGQSDMTKDAGITPIVIDLDGNGIHTVSRADATGSFDLFGNGTAVKSGWISGGDGFLAVDKNGNGKIDSISELFGGTAKGAGFANLATYDSNGDGVVDAKDAAFGDLRIWQDTNGNHATDAGELMTLGQAGIASLTVGYTELPFLDAQGNLHLERSSATLADGHAVSMTDVYFNVAADDAAAAGVALPTMAELLGNDSSLDGVLGGSTSTTARSTQQTADVAAGGHDAAEVLRRLAALTQEACHSASAA